MNEKLKDAMKEIWQTFAKQFVGGIVAAALVGVLAFLNGYKDLPRDVADLSKASARTEATVENLKGEMLKLQIGGFKADIDLEKRIQHLEDLRQIELHKR